MTNKTMRASVQNQKSDLPEEFGFYISLLTGILTTLTLGIAIATPPLSGPFCRADCFQYPFLDIASRFPRDYIWMYPAIVFTALYLILFVCINSLVQNGRKIFSQCGLVFATISACTLILDYFVQISIIHPSVLNGEADGISLLSQFNPHCLFIAMEEMGFLMMSISFLCAAPVFSVGRLEKTIRWIFIISFIATAITLILFTVFLGVHREYFFEITAISINCLALISASFLLSAVFKRGKGELLREQV